jgi:hypothetical protein
MRFAAFACALTLFLPVAALAQEPPPKIPLFVFDIHGTVPRFPEDQGLVDSRSSLTSIAELPGTGLGLQLAAQLHFFRWKAVTFGIGGDFTTGHASQTPPEGSTGLVATTERLQSLGSTLSFNFGNGNGWSYISGGIGTSTWSLVATGSPETPQDTERLKTVNYGGGARWFAKPHLAFSFDVRFYAINPGTPYLGLPGSPRTTLLIIGAGISVK